MALSQILLNDLTTYVTPIFKIQIKLDYYCKNGFIATKNSFFNGSNATL